MQGKCQNQVVGMKINNCRVRLDNSITLNLCLTISYLYHYDIDFVDIVKNLHVQDVNVSTELIGYGIF